MKKILFAIALCGSLVSCNKFLDMTPRDSISDKVMWANTESAEYAVNSIYSYAYDIFAAWPSAVGLTEAFTDEFKYGSYVNFAYCLIPSQVAYGGTNLTNSFVDVYLGCWGSLYNAIRRTNEAMSNLKNLGSGIPEADRTRLQAELRLMRGWLYFELVKRYKEVIIYDEDLSKIAVEKALSSEADGWDFIWQDLDFAAKNRKRRPPRAVWTGAWPWRWRPVPCCMPASGRRSLTRPMNWKPCATASCRSTQRPSACPWRPAIRKPSSSTASPMPTT